MTISASKRRWIAALAAVIMVCMCAAASAQSFSLGDEADEIATIQTALKHLDLYTGEITGHFGSKTEAAVKKFQKRYALLDDGIVGEDTLKALYEAAGITSSGSTSSGSASSSSDNGVLRYGVRSDAVRRLQQDLTTLGYYNGALSGHFGSKTEAAVMSFQRKNGLSADGIAGSRTLAKIATALGSSQSGSSSNSNSGSGAPADTLLKYGVRSEAVRSLQQNLKQLGYYSGSITGNFGRLTKEAVMNFQRANSLSPDGIAGDKTLKAITKKLNGESVAPDSGSHNSDKNDNSESSSGDSSTRLNVNNTLMEGSSSEEVRKLQIMLTKLGYYKGNKTGNFGPKTSEAVKSFQKAKGLTADGIAGKRTLSAINADFANGVTAEKPSGTPNTSGSNKASSVLYQDFYSWRRRYENGEYCTVYDPATGYSWRLRIMTKDAHMDAEPATSQDTEIMYRAFGNKNTWTPKPVWVTFSDGKTYMGSTHNVPHAPQHIRDNNFEGHLCVHFPIAMSRAEKIGPYAVSHQEAINEGWEETQKMAH